MGRKRGGPKGRLPTLESLESRQLLASVSGMHLAQDTGMSPTDRISREAQVAALVSWRSSRVTQVDVEFDHNGDGQPEGMVTATSSATAFSYDPLATDAALAQWEGPFTLRYRTVAHRDGDTRVGDWQSFSMTLDRVAPVPLYYGPSAGSSSTGALESVTVTFDESLDASSVQATSLQLTSLVSDPITLGPVSMAGTNQLEAPIYEGNLEYGDYTTNTVSVSDLAGNWYGSTTSSQWQYLVAPTAAMIAPITVQEDADNVVLDLFAVFDDTETADADLVLTVAQNTNPDLFSSVSINPSTGELTLDFAPDANGMAVLTLQAADEQGLTVSTTVMINVTPANDPPRIEDFVGIEGQTYWTFSGTIVDEFPGNLTVTFGGLLSGLTVVSDSNGMFEIQVIINQSGTVSAQTVDSQNLMSNIALEYVVV